MNMRTPFCNLLLLLLMGCTSGQVSLNFEKKIELPGLADQPQAFTVANWNSKFLLASAFLSGRTYLIDVDAGQYREMDAPPGVVDLVEYQSPSSTLAAVARDTGVEVYDVRDSQTVLKVSSLKMRSPPLLVKALSLTETDSQQTLTLVGDAKSNDPVIVRLPTGGQGASSSWRFPAGKDTFHLVSASISAGGQSDTVAMLVNRYSPRLQDGATTHDLSKEFWIVRFPGNGIPCVIRPLPVFRIPYFDTSSLHGPVLSPDGRQVVFTTKANAALSVYDTSVCRQTASAPLVGPFAPTELAFSPDGKWLIGTTPTTRNARTANVTIWGTKDWSPAASVRQAVAYQPSFSKDSKRVAIGTIGGLDIYRLIEKR